MGWQQRSRTEWQRLVAGWPSSGLTQDAFHADLTLALTDGLQIEVGAQCSGETLKRVLAVGRKAWSFAGSPRGAEASAMLFTLVETAKAAGLEPRAYRHYLFETLPKMTIGEDIDVLLPHRLKPRLLKIPAPVL